MSDTEVLIDDLVFPEGPRWHDGKLWFSDMYEYRVKTVDPDGRVEVVVEVPGTPSGLGWDPEGRLLVVSMADRRLLRWAGDGLDEVSDLSGLSPFQFNDLVVDAEGRAYTGNFGFDIHSGAKRAPAIIARVDIDGRATVAADDLKFPNGMVITPDGSTLIVGETFGHRVTAFHIATDGSLDDRRVFAEADELVPDGMCLDAEGAVWVANPVKHEVARVREGGEVVERVSTGDRGAYACMLGGVDRRTLYVCTSLTHDPDESVRLRSGRIEQVRVDVPGAGLP
jgi:YD repeat-containing protein